ncbi:hypothetical protein CLU79DRAFT_768289 [Phycomyces nitens]|nr:hypothetical protein CLU79DRAFT_768289 [Phycomyces nitens]
MITPKTSRNLYTASLFFLIFLTAICLAISAADVIIQALTDRTESEKFDYRNLVVVGGAYVLLTVLSLLFSCSRLFTVKSSLQDIPKIYIPIKEDDLPKKVFHHIQQQFTNVKEVRNECKPLSSDIKLVGRALPGEPLFDGVDFKRAISRTHTIIENAAIELNPEYARPLYVPVRQYIEFLMHHNLVDPQLGRVYLEGYERARFSPDQVSQAEYLDIMKHLAVMLHHMGFYFNLKAHSETYESGNTTDDGSDNESFEASNSTASPGSHQRRNVCTRSTSIHDPARTRSIDQRGPLEDDVASLAQSVATWTSRSTSTVNQRNPHSVTRASLTRPDLEHNYTDEEKKLTVYERLMMDRISMRM